MPVGKIKAPAAAPIKPRDAATAARAEVSAAMDPRVRAELPKMDAEIVKTAKFNAKTPAGAEALTWHYRSALALGQGDALKVFMHQDMFEAEKSPFRFLGFSRLRGHLNDNEIKKLLETDDLRGFVRERKAEVEAVVGDWDAFLASGGGER